MKTIPVDVRHLEYALGIDLHEFEAGHIYPLAKLMTAMGYHKHASQRSEEEKRS